MGTHKLAGFTIIETMLFLGISGALIVAFIGGAAASINIQRYRDATETLKSVLQQQYADLTSVQNSRDDSWSCGATAAPSKSGPTSEYRGQSECTLLGKYVRIEDDAISIYKVIGFEKPGGDLNDIESLKNNYTLNVSKDEVETSDLEWDTQIGFPTRFNDSSVTDPGSNRKVGLLIIRSPDSGLIYTFNNEGGDVPDDAEINGTALSEMLIAGDSIPGQGKVLLCVNPNGLLATSDRGILINKFATGSSAVEIRTNDYMESEETGDKC